MNQNKERGIKMEEVRMIALLCFALAAALKDLACGRIPNSLIVTGLLLGLAYQLLSGRILGALLFFGGALLPLLLLGGLYYFRMIGAGDIKLFCVVGGFLGPVDGFSCMAAAFLIGGLCSAAILLRGHLLFRRLVCLTRYFIDYIEKKQWRSYREELTEDAKFCFAVPVLLSVLCYMGGFL